MEQEAPSSNVHLISAGHLTVGLREMPIKSGVCMRKHSFPKAAGAELMAGWRTGCSVDRGFTFDPFPPSPSVSANGNKEIHRLIYQEK